MGIGLDALLRRAHGVRVIARHVSQRLAAVAYARSEAVLAMKLARLFAGVRSKARGVAYIAMARRELEALALLPPFPLP